MLARWHRWRAVPVRGPPVADPHDIVRTTLAGIRFAKGTARKQTRPLTADLVRQVVADLNADRPADCRDAALLV